MNTGRVGGFTLYELLITILVIGVVITLGIPNFGEFTANSRMTSTANDLHSSFQLARSEAARAKANITICASPNSMDLAAANCGGEFENGWIVFVDEDGDINRDPGEAVVRSFPAVPNGITISNPGTGDYFSYAPTGLGRGDVGALPALQRAILCDDRGNETAAGGLSSARALVVTPVGRAAVLRDVDQVQAQGGCP
jgi:type IV fimbrial biogenesis protein FimT